NNSDDFRQTSQRPAIVLKVDVYRRAGRTRNAGSFLVSDQQISLEVIEGVQLAVRTGAAHYIGCLCAIPWSRLQHQLRTPSVPELLSAPLCQPGVEPDRVDALSVFFVGAIEIFCQLAGLLLKTHPIAPGV